MQTTESPVPLEPVLETNVPLNDSPANPQNLFSVLGLNPGLSETTRQLGYEHPTPIQSETIPVLLSGQDVLGQAQTGTGKTAAFALPILSQLKLQEKRAQCLVLAPTRELAIQVGQAFQQYGTSLKNLNVATICGGQDYQKQIRQLRKGAHIVVGTPGRVIDLIQKKELALSHLRWAVLDEADEMLRMGFEEDVQWILSQTPKTVSMALFSATLPPQIQEISKNYLKNPVRVSIQQKTSTAETIAQKYIVAHNNQKKDVLARLLEASQIDGAIVFVKTKSSTEPLAEFLQKRLGFPVSAINGDIPQTRREQIISNLKSGKTDVIVATDVAARGLDIERISHVINYDLPQDIESYVHRIGRTGRAGRAGCSVLFLKPSEETVLKKITQSTQQPIQKYQLPSKRDVNQSRIKQFHQSILKNLEHPELDQCKSIISQLQSSHSISSEDISAALALMLNSGQPFLQTEDLKLPEFNQSKRGKNGSKEFIRSPTRFGSRGAKNLKTYRMEVGSRHNVKPGNIVGAIANEIEIDNESIGRIKIFAKFSIIDLPDDLSTEQLKKLGKVSIGKRPLKITEDSRKKPSKFKKFSGETTPSQKRQKAKPKWTIKPPQKRKHFTQSF
ncbi:MAG: DEAD/DEAH box helicase [Planctomycetota bacterium]|nr:DEAD/DEAH box helicase [Planctomycetota bacterium]